MVSRETSATRCLPMYGMTCRVKCLAQVSLLFASISAVLRNISMYVASVTVALSAGLVSASSR
jgi:hypothetical protein